VTAAAAPAGAEEQAEKKLANFLSILASKNDNDPRLDSEFRHLSPELKAKLEGFYKSLPPESLNQKGTVVFLLGRDMESPADADFLLSVLEEPPCLNLLHCSAAGLTEGNEEDIANGVTLAYPQIVALKYAAKLWDVYQGSAPREELRSILEKASHSPNGSLAHAAQAALASIQHH
jgi:hypothetical protein